MSSGWPLGLDVCNGVSAAIDPTISQGMLVSPSATPNTKGSWTQLNASTTYDCTWVGIGVQYYNFTPATVAVDIGVGGSGSEVVLVPNIVVECQNNFASEIFIFPLSIPAGTRLSARAQSSVGTGGYGPAVSVRTWDGAFTQIEGFAGVDAIGFNSATTLGTAVDPGGSPNTKGSYSQLVASSAKDYSGMFLSIDAQNNGSVVPGEAYLIDIAIGAAASEKVIFPDLIQVWGSNCFAPCVPFIPVNIPSGTRISARCQSSDTDILGVTAYGVYL